MFRVLNNSTMFEKASTRLQGMQAIDPALDLGNGLSVAAIEAALKEARIKHDAYKKEASMLEEKQIEFEDASKVLTDLLTRTLASVAGKYGKDSIEYAQLGGTRVRDRKRPVRKSKTVPKSEL